MQVTRPVLIAAVAVFAGLLATVFFLLGRESVRRRPAVASAGPPTEPAVAMAAPPTTLAPVPAPVPAAAAAPIVASTPSPSPAPPMPTAGSVAATPPPAAAPPPVQPPIHMTIQSVTPPAAAGGNFDETTAVRDYFLRVQGIQATAPSTDPNEFANKLLSSGMTGDLSGFDELVRVTEEGEHRAEAITPPASCAECADYHQHLLSMLGESASMMRQLRTAFASKNPSALQSMSTAGASLQARANALDQQARQIKAQYGL